MQLNIRLFTIFITKFNNSQENPKIRNKSNIFTSK